VSVCLFSYLPICLFVCLFVCLFLCLSACLSACLPACLPGFLSVCLRVSACVSVCLSVFVFIFLSVWRYGRSLPECTLGYAPGLTRKHWTRLERLARDRHFSLFRKFVNYSHKKLYNIGPWLDRLKGKMRGKTDSYWHISFKNIQGQGPVL